MTNNWTEICVKCKDGDILPEHCEYFGEPNGCNSPIYGEHPTAENSSVVGDRAKLREALKHIKDRLPHMLQYMRVHWEDASAGGYFDELMLVIDAALAAPPRNCDMWTVGEQFERWCAFCDRYDKDCTGCPCKSPHSMAYCFAKWAQMPHEEGGAS